MIITKGTKVTVNHKRKGRFEGVVTKDFDPDTCEFYPIATLEYVNGEVNEWAVGEEIPCRNTLCVIYPHN